VDTKFCNTKLDLGGGKFEKDKGRGVVRISYGGAKLSLSGKGISLYSAEIP